MTIFDESEEFSKSLSRGARFFLTIVPVVTIGIVGVIHGGKGDSLN